MKSITEMTLKEVFNFVANKENRIYEKVPEFAKELDKEKYLKKSFLEGKDIKVARLSAVTFVPTKKNSHYWNGRRFKLVYEVMDEKANSVTVGWGWTPNGDGDIYDDKPCLYLSNARLDCTKSGLMRRVYFDNCSMREDLKRRDYCDESRYLYAVWIDGEFTKVCLLEDI